MPHEAYERGRLHYHQGVAKNPYADPNKAQAWFAGWLYEHNQEHPDEGPQPTHQGHDSWVPVWIVAIILLVAISIGILMGGP